VENKIKAKRVGDVSIFEICGELTGDFASRSEEAMHECLANMRHRNALFNVQELRQIDKKGVGAILENACYVTKSAVLCEPNPVRNYIQASDTTHRLSYFQNREDVAYYFSKEFAAPSLGEQCTRERRRYIRLKTSLPTHFWFESEEGKLFQFFAVATNLSEGGLFAQFIESVSEDSVKQKLNPYDFQLLHIRVALLGENPVEGVGKLIHGNIREGGIGIELYEMDDENRDRLRHWIASHLKAGNP
jgi:hypothetical protein